MSELGQPIRVTDKTAIGAGANVTAVQGPSGLLFLSDLPKVSPERWVIRRKAEIVAAVRGGILRKEEALSRYQLTEDEFRSWEAIIDRSGILALRATRIQEQKRGVNLASQMLTNASCEDARESFGVLTIDYANHQVQIEGVNIHLTPSLYAVLELLVLLRANAVPKEAILDYLYFGESEPEMKIVDVYICTLRKKLRMVPGVRIKTVWGRGYCFVHE